MAEKLSYKSWQVPPAAVDEKERLGWIDDACGDGISWIKSQRGFRDYRKSLDTISGTDTQPTYAASYRSRVNPNRLKRNIREVVSALSKLRPWWGYHSDNPTYTGQALMMNMVSRAWYLESGVSQVVKEALQFAAATGRGWLHPVYRRDMAGTGKGDIELCAYGAPSILPTQMPSSGKYQKAYAITILDEWPIYMAHGVFPAFQDKLVPNTSKFWYQNDMVHKAALGNVWNRMFGKAPRSDASGLPELLIPIRKTYIIDLSINTTDRPIPMGDPGSTWSYTVPYIGQEIPTGNGTYRKADENDARLYPYRRLIISSDKCITYDGPAFDWHGMFPGVSFALDAWPWEPIGFSQVHDGYELNESIKEIMRGNMDKIRSQLDPPLAFDTNATSMKEMKRFDPMQPRARIGLDGNAVDGKGVDLAVPMDVLKVYPESMAMIDKLEQQLDAQMAINDVAALAKARTVGSMDELEKIMETQGPIVEDMSASMEPPMRDLGNMVKYNILQYYTTPRVMQIVGVDGVHPQVFDYDPASLVPSHMPGESPDHASAADKITRARTFADNLRFFILPSSLHEMTQMAMKLGLIQLKKAGVGIDDQTLAESWELPNYGTIPGNTIRERWEQQQEEQLEFAARMQQIAGAEGLIPPGTPPGAAAPPAKPNPEGRPPSGNAAPRLVSKDGGARSTITESR